MPVIRNRVHMNRVRLTPRVKLWIESAGTYCFGFGISEILQAVEQTGSIKEAARKLGRSYRYVWGRIKKVERALGRTLVDTQVGGQEAQRSSLTDAANRFLSEYLQMRGRIIELVEQEFAERFG
jgi:molybdate transport system regulatory protein